MAEEQSIIIKKVKLDELKPRDRNPRTISDRNYENLKRSLTELGQLVNLVINKDNIILSGNQRHKAMQELGWTECVVSVVDLPEESFEDALNLIMNSPRARGFFLTERYNKILLDNKEGFISIGLGDEIVTLEEGGSQIVIDQEPAVNFLSDETLASRTGTGESPIISGGVLITIGDIKARMSNEVFREIQHRCLMGGHNPAKVMVDSLYED